jgi:16S rRNA (guanine(527)-N(7))-methyltransferase RsmG
VGFVRNIEPDGAALGRLLSRLGLSLSFLSPLLAHARAVQRDAVRIGLVSPSDIDQIVLRHSADSLLFALVRRPATGEQWVDVGSGAGFPGLVLACCFPECSFTLLEPLRKRAGFLELQAADLGLINVVVDPRRHEEIPDGTFDVAVARALAEPEAALTSMIRLVRIGGDALVAVGASGSVQGTTVVRLEGVGFVDSPGVFSMMTRER